MGLGTNLGKVTLGQGVFHISLVPENELLKFFKILPLDWKEELESSLKSYQANWLLVLIYRDDEVVGGGLLFNDLTQDVKMYSNDIQYLVDQGFLYIAYVWILPAYRGLRLGNYWLDLISKEIDCPGFWLSIEDSKLRKFYEASGFRVTQEVEGPNGIEWILAKSSTAAEFQTK